MAAGRRRIKVKWRGDTADAAHSYQASVRVAVFSHDSLVVQDILEGLARETSERRTQS